tara:strand:+ start:936 stop:1631 length:696 start_codon:yes stop_codon:yes gene_type:complete
MKLFDKIFFLYKSKASFIIYMIFLKTKIINILFKNKIKDKKKSHKKFLITKKITQDYFSSHAYNFYKIIKKFKNFKYLEIGSFEGNSAMFVAKNFKNSKIYCVDNWFGTEEYNNLNFSTLENNFDFNMREFNNINKFKMLSNNFFKNNKINFDIIYIDGYHKGFQVLEDFKNSWNILNDNGVIIFDDFIWKFYDKIEDNPCFVINSYLRNISNKVKILKVSNSQLFIQKKL